QSFLRRLCVRVTESPPHGEGEITASGVEQRPTGVEIHHNLRPRHVCGVAVSLPLAMRSTRRRTQTSLRDTPVDPMLLPIVGEKHEIAVLHDAIDEPAN